MRDFKIGQEVVINLSGAWTRVILTSLPRNPTNKEVSQARRWNYPVTSKWCDWKAKDGTIAGSSMLRNIREIK